MKAFQRWRNQHSTSADSHFGNQRIDSSSKSKKGSDTRIGLSSSSSVGVGSTGYSDPQDVLYPSAVEANSDPLKFTSGIKSNQRSSNGTGEGNVWKKGPRRKQSDLKLNKSFSADSLIKKGGPSNPSSPKLGNRIRFDSLIGRKNESSNTQTNANFEEKEEKQNFSTGRWNGSVRSFSSPKSKEDVDLPDDILSMPKISAKSRKSVKEDTPLLVLAKDVKSSSSLISDQSGNAVSGQGRMNNLQPIKTSSINGVKDSGRKDNLSPTKVSSRRLPSEATLKSSLDDHNNRLRVASNPTESYNTLRASRSTGGLLQISKDTSYHTSSQRSSLSFGEAQTDIISSPNAKQNISASSATIKSQSSNMSLRTSRSRISGMFSMKNKSTPGLPYGVESTGDDSQRHHLQNSRSFSAPFKPTTPSQDLANDLNGLAVAFEEGLLGAEEYRLLRKGVFDSMMKQGAMEVPREQTIRSAQNASENDNNPTTSDDQSMVFSMGSKKSGKSKATSLFRSRSQKTQLPISAPGAFPSSRSMVGSIISYSGQDGDQSKAALQDQFSQARRARTLRSVAGVSKVVDPPFKQTRSFSANDTSHFSSDSYDEPSQFVNSRITQTGPVQISANGLTISSGNALLGQDYAEKSSAEIEAEVAVVEAEGKRLLDSFKTLELHAVGRYDLTFEQIRQSIKRVEDLSPGSVPSEIRDGFVFVSSSDVDNSKMTNGKGMNRRSSLFSSKRQSSISSTSSSNLANASQANYSNRARIAQPPPSSFKGKGEIQSSHQLRSRKSLPQNLSAAASSSTSNDRDRDRTEDVGVQTLTNELIEIHRRRTEVAKKYDSRLAFLRSALRSARIREGLR